jgi:DNA-binding response OmpR family regulator
MNRPAVRPKVLVVDDEEGVRRSLHLLLTAADYDVLELPDGRDVLDTVKREGINVVVTDILMPRKEGIETITLLRKECPAVPIIAMTGGPEHYLDAAFFLGAARVLTKPFGLDHIVEYVRELVGENERMTDRAALQPLDADDRVGAP